jgi:hypothetical protein
MPAEDYHAPGGRSSSVEVCWWRTDPRDRPSSWRGTIDGAGDAQASATGLIWSLPDDITDE